MYGSYARFLLNSQAIAEETGMSPERAKEYNRRVAEVNSEGFTEATSEEHGRKLRAIDEEFGIVS